MSETFPEPYLESVRFSSPNGLVTSTPGSPWHGMKVLVASEPGRERGIGAFWGYMIWVFSKIGGTPKWMVYNGKLY